MRNKIIKMAEALEGDVTIFNTSTDILYLDKVDFIGFDSEWNEIFVQFQHPEKVMELQNFLKENCDSITKDRLYEVFKFHTFKVYWGWTSFDI